MTNVEILTNAGIIPQGYDGFEDYEIEAINDLTDEEVQAIISASAKIHGVRSDFMEQHAPHGVLY